jgi:putative lipoprotein
MGLVGAVSIAVLALASSGDAETMFLETTVTYRERIALPPDAVLEVELLDTSRADAPSIRMASQLFKLTGVPRTVRIGYDPELIDDRYTYTVSASIMSDRRVLFRSTTATPVLTRGAPSSAELVLQMMPSQDTGNDTGGFISGIAWAAFEIGGRMLSAEDPPTLTIDQDGNFGLYGGCNRFTGVLTAQDGVLSMPDHFAGTMMACPGPREQLERDTLEALATAAGYHRNGSNLTLTNAAGAAVLRFREMPE